MPPRARENHIFSEITQSGGWVCPPDHPSEQPQPQSKIAPRSMVAADRPLKSSRTNRDGLSPLYDAAIRGVQLRFKHLDPDDIRFPPHAWFDAALARQIAVHLLNRQFHVPKRAIAKTEIMGSREAVNRALKTVDERMNDAHFAASYAAMARHAVTAAKAKKTRLKR